MREASLRDVLFVRAFEESDMAGELIGLRERQIASREVRAELAASSNRDGTAQHSEPRPEDFLERRAKRLRERILRVHPQAQRVFELSGRRGLPLWSALLGALLVGAFVDHLGSTQTINLLDFPILGLLAYNVIVYVALFASDLGSSGARRLSEGRASRAAASGLVARLLLWAASPDRFWSRGGKSGGHVAVATQRFVRDWYRVAVKLHLARGATWMHMSAAGLMLGAVLGMYLRGLVFHYDASWESTFLTAGAVHTLLETVFAPAAWILGSDVPDLVAIKAMQHPKGGDAAQWIHLYGVTGLLWVVLPRLGLSFFAYRTARSLERNIPLRYEDDAYFLRLLATERGAGREVTVESYSYKPVPRSADGLKSLLLDLFGGRVVVTTLDPVSYGDDPAAGPELEESATHCRVALFSLAQSPEHEVHGEYLRKLLEAVGDRPGRRGVLVVIDSGPYRERLGREADAEDRLEERERNWKRVLRDAGLDAVFCELEGRADPLVLENAHAAIWPASLEGESA